MTKLSDLSALTGATVVPADDLIHVADMSETGVARSKKMTFAELKVAVVGPDLTAIEGLTSAANKIPYFTGAGTAALLDLDADDTLAADSDTAIPTQQAVKAYVAVEVASAGTPIEVLDEGVSETAALVSLDFVGAGVAAVDDGSGNVTVTIGGGGSAIEVLDEGVSETASLVSLDFVGANVAAVDDGSGNVTVTVSGGGGGGAWRCDWNALKDVVQPSSNPATLDTRNGRPVFDFDATTSESLYLHGVLPSDYAGGGITFRVSAMLTSATSGTLGWTIAFERFDASGLDGDTDSFATAQTITATTVPGTSGQIITLTVNVSDGANMDSLAAGENFRIKLSRDTANDTATGDAEFVSADMVEQ